MPRQFRKAMASAARLPERARMAKPSVKCSDSGRRSNSVSGSAPTVRIMASVST
jgi:hypothetical protein